MWQYVITNPMDLFVILIWTLTMSRRCIWLYDHDCVVSPISPPLFSPPSFAHQNWMAQELKEKERYVYQPVGHRCL